MCINTTKDNDDVFIITYQYAANTGRNEGYMFWNTTLCYLYSIQANKTGHMLSISKRANYQMKQDETGKFYVKGVSKQNLHNIFFNVLIVVFEH